jgi:hypothetical protein
MKSGQGGKIFLVLLLLAIGTLLWSCSEDRVRFRITYDVQTPSGLISESHTLETWRKQGGGMKGRYSYGLRGEAAVIKLGADKLMFALLKLNDPSQGSDGMMWLPQQAYGTELTAQCLASIPPGGHCNIQDGDRSDFKQRTLPPKLYPMLVTFDDINDPKTVRLVDPENLAATFGEGFALKSISVEITDEKVTAEVVGKVLVWLPDYYDKNFDGQKYETMYATNRLANSLASGAFKAGKDK